MADEITVTLTMQANKGDTNYTVPASGSPFSIDMTGTNVLLPK